MPKSFKNPRQVIQLSLNRVLKMDTKAIKFCSVCRQERIINLCSTYSGTGKFEVIVLSQESNG